ncbi:MAG: polysaccharide biosynthesis/export family protein [Pseudorhodobacter sp.]
MHRFATVLFLVVGAVALGACAAPRGAALSSEILKMKDPEDTRFAVVPVTRDNVAALRKWPVTGGAAGHRWIEARQGPASAMIRPGDRISLMIWDSQENSLLAAESEKAVKMADLVVSPAGAIFVPYLDEVVVNGQTPDQARRQIQQALAPIVPSAQVQLSMEPGRQNSVDLVSGVAKPGNYPLPDRNYSILSLIALGGGIDSGMRNPLVRLIRGGERYEIPAEKLLSNPALNATLRGDDKVLVEEDKRYFTALGATGTQSLIHFEQQEITAMETLSMIGGLEASRADPKGVLILRDYPASALRPDGTGPSREQVVFTFDLTQAEGLFAARSFRIHPKDTVLVTEASLVTTRNILGLVGTMLGLANTVASN